MGTKKIKIRGGQKPQYDPAPILAEIRRRKLRGIPAGVEWIARNAGVSIATVSRVRQGKASLIAVGKVCSVLGVDPDAVVSGNDEAA